MANIKIKRLKTITINLWGKLVSFFGGVKRNFWSTRNRKIFTILSLVAILGIIFLTTRKPTLSVETTTVKRSDLVETVSASGKIVASESADLSFKISGKLVYLPLDEGDKVTKYQTVASLDPQALSISLQQAKNTLRYNEANVEKVHDDVKNHASDESFDQKLTRTTAEVANDNAYDAVRAAETALKDSYLLSPINGVIAILNIKTVGVNVVAGTPIMTIINPASVYFQAQVDEVDIAKIQKNQDVDISLDAYPDETFKGEVKEIGITSFLTSTGGTGYMVNITLSKEAINKAKQGMNGDANFVLSTKKDVLTIPSTAIVEIGGKNYVWIDKNGKADSLEVSVGVSSINDTEITSGLSEGQKIIVRPPTKIAKGDKIVSQ